jgi:ArsR family transcriptional regulator
MNSTAIIATLNALAHEYRLAAFRLLVQAGPDGINAGTIAAGLGMSPAATSFHLKDLVRAGLIQPRHEGRQIFYSARFETMNGLVQYLTENCCGGSPCVAACAPACAVDAGNAP